MEARKQEIAIQRQNIAGQISSLEGRHCRPTTKHSTRLAEMKATQEQLKTEIKTGKGDKADMVTGLQKMGNKIFKIQEDMKEKMAAGQEKMKQKGEALDKRIKEDIKVLNNKIEETIKMNNNNKLEGKKKEPNVKRNNENDSQTWA